MRHGLASYRGMGRDKHGFESRRGFVRRGDLPDGFTQRDVYRRGWAGLTQREETAAALALLCDYGWLTATRRNFDGLGRPTLNYFIHPQLRK